MNSGSRSIFLTLSLVLALPACSGAQTGRPAIARAAAPPSVLAIDSNALEILHRNQRAMLALQTYSAECRTVLIRDQPGGGASKRYILSTMFAEKPNRIRYDAWELKADPAAKGWRRPPAVPQFTFVSNGSAGWKQVGNAYRKDDRVKPEQITTILEPWTGFYTLGDSAYGAIMARRKANEIREVRSMGRETVQGVPCDKVLVVTVSANNGGKLEDWTTWYIGSEGLVRRSISKVAFNDKPGVTRDSILTNIKPNAPVDRKRFAYVPPPGVTPAKETPQRSAGLPVGAQAPNFSALDARNKPVKLSDYRGKVVIVDFWASWCGPCMASMPHTQSVMQKLKAQRLPVVLLAVDDGEPRPEFDAWVAKNGAALSALTFVHSPPSKGVSGSLFQVTGIPSQFVLDRKGTVRASFVGYGGPTDALEKAVRAALTK